MAAYRKGRRLILLQFERGLYDRLEDDVFEFVRGHIGKEVVFVEQDPEYGLLDVKFVPPPGMLTFLSVWVEPSWVKQATP